jgi:hypothetical protein
MSDHIEESLKSAALDGVSSEEIRSRLEQRLQSRQTRARAISGAGIAALAILAITAMPRSTSAAEVYAQISKAFRDGKAFRITMRKHYEGDPDRTAMEQIVHQNGFVSTYFKDSTMEFTMREDDQDAVLYFPRLNLAQRPQKSKDDWRSEAPGKDEDLLAYVQRRLVTGSSDRDGESKSLTPLRVVQNVKLDGRPAVRLEFEDNSLDHSLWKYELYADPKTKQPLLLTTEMDRKTPTSVRKLYCRYTFEFVPDPSAILREIPPQGVPIVDMPKALEETKKMADISPLFGGVRRAFRGPHGSLLLVTHQPAFEGRNPVKIGTTEWLPCMTASSPLGDVENPDFYVSTFALLENSEKDWSALPFPVESADDAWPAGAGGLVVGRALAKEFTEIAFVRALRYKDLKQYDRAKEILIDASRQESLLVPGVTVAFREAMAEIDKEKQR